MEVYKIPIEFAFIVFPFIAFILTIPFLIHQYRKYGAIPLLKSAIFYSMILYLISAYFLVMLPLPSIEKVSKMTGPTTQLHLFQFVKDIIATVNFDINGLSDIINIIKKPTVYTVLFNIVLTLPFGIYLRYFFGKKWYQTLLYTFLLSLFFELTQLSGLYGIYPRPYRLFDVDDLLINSIGGLIGHTITPMITFFLPSRNELEEKSYKKGTKVTLLRRIIALSIDILFISIFGLVSKILLYGTVFSDYYLLITVSIYYAIPIFSSGQTLGKRFLRLKIETTGPNESLMKYKIFFRNFMLVYVFLYPFTWVSLLPKNTAEDIMNRLYLVIGIIELANLLVYIWTVATKKEHLFLYELLSKTKNISIIESPPSDTKMQETKKDIISESKNIGMSETQKTINEAIDNCKKKRKNDIIN